MGAVAFLEETNATRIFKLWTDFLDVAPRSAETYNGALKSFFKYLAEKGLKVENVTRENIKDYLNVYCANTAQATRALRLQVVKRFYNFLGDASPARNIKIKSVEKTFHKNFLTKDAANALLNAAENPRDKALLALMLCTGLRVCEVYQANVGDFDYLPDGQKILRILGKGRKEKNEFVKIPKPVDLLIKAYLQGRVDGALFLSDGHNSAGKRLSMRRIREIAKNLLRGIGLDSKRYSTHSLRHTAAVANLQAGGSLAETMQLLRHKKIETTQIYTHALERLQNCSENRIADYLMGAA